MLAGAIGALLVMAVPIPGRPAAPESLVPIPGITRPEIPQEPQRPAPQPLIEAPFEPEEGEARIAAALTESLVEVDTGYAGASIVLYGAVFNPGDIPADVVVVVRGPDRPVRLVRKVRVLGMWLNSRPVLFEGAPGYYMTASTRPLSEVADFGTLRRLAVGVDHLRINAPEEQISVTRYGVRDVVISRLEEDYLDWRRAVIRLLENAGLYDTLPRGVTFVDDDLFRAEVVLPVTAPTGIYETEVWLFLDGEPVSVRRGTLSVEKVGVERALYDFAHERAWFYGLLALILAMLTGWGVSAWFRRT